MKKRMDQMEQDLGKAVTIEIDKAATIEMDKMEEDLGKAIVVPGSKGDRGRRFNVTWWLNERPSWRPYQGS